MVLLLWNPAIPAALGGAANVPGANVPWILIDGSASMAAADGGEDDSPQGSGSSLEASAWSEALRWAEEEGGNAHVATFGGPVIGPEAAEMAGPTWRTSRLGPALDRAFESGASEVTVVSDMRITDAASVKERLLDSRTPVRFEVVGAQNPVNAGIGRFVAPATVSRRDSIPLELTVVTAGISDSVEVRILEEGRLLSTHRIAPASQGRESVVRVSVPTPDETGTVRYTSEVSVPGDQFSLDDRRDVLVDIDPVAGGLVLISFAADWEPRFLLPVLGQVTGLTPQGFVALSDGRFLSLAAGPGGGSVTTAEEVRSRVEGAELLVVHGASESLPSWVSDAVVSVSRAVVFAVDAEGASLLGHTVGPPKAGEWYASSDPTPSALAGSLADIQWGSLPPLTGLLSGGAGLTGDVPLSIQLQGSGPAEPAMVMTSEGTRRRVTVLTTGYWRWAFRPGDAREAYRRLWASVGGWLLANEPLSGGPGIRPTRSVSAAGMPHSWRATSWSGEELGITIRDQAELVVDTLVMVSEAGGFELPGLPAGDYAYEVVAGDEGSAGAGRFVMDIHSLDMAIPIMSLPPEASGDGLETGRAAGPPGRPLRTHPLPFLIVLVLMCAEWVLRRRRGLR